MRGRLLHTINSLALSVCSRWSHPPPPKWEALAIHAKFPVSPEALPLGELDAKRPERARTLTKSIPLKEKEL